MDSFKDKKVWIIGASSGIGLALARELSRRGARLILSARNGEALAQLNGSLESKHHVIPFDVADAAAFQRAANDIATIDSVILLSAIYTPMPLGALDLQQTRAIVDTNLNGAFNCLAAVLPILHKQKYGQIALCGSVAGYRGIAGGQPYSATKAAIMNLAESLKQEEEKKGVDVRLISPGFVRTPMTGKNDFKMPMMIEPEEAARAIADGLLSSCFEIHFPKRFTYIMKLLRMLPSWLYFSIMRRMS